MQWCYIFNQHTLIMRIPEVQHSIQVSPIYQTYQIMCCLFLTIVACPMQWGPTVWIHRFNQNPFIMCKNNRIRLISLSTYMHYVHSLWILYIDIGSLLKQEVQNAEISSIRSKMQCRESFIGAHVEELH